MEVNKANSMRKISSLEEIKQTPQDKENARTNDEHERQIEALKLKIKKYEAELFNQHRNTIKLCAKMDSIVAEHVQFFGQSADYKGKGKDVLASEIKTLIKIIEQQKSVQKQLKVELETASNRKMEMDMKENIMAQEHVKLKAQVQTLTNDLNRSLSELKSFKFGNKMEIMRLKYQSVSQSKKLKIAQKKCSQYKKEIGRLNQVLQRKSARHLRQRNAGNNIMHHYKNELKAKLDLANQISFKMKCEDSVYRKIEMSTTVNDLKSSFALLSQKRIDLEAKLKADTLIQRKAIEERDKKIKKLKTELFHANELLRKVRAQNESTKNDPEVASQLIGADMSLTELYSLYVGTINELEVQRREKAAISLQLKNILEKFSKNAPVIREHVVKYDKLMEVHNSLVQKQEDLLFEKNELKEKLEVGYLKEFDSARELKKLKISQSDLSRQICCLIKEAEQLRTGFTSDGASRQDEAFSTGNYFITKKLVEFKTIDELQKNNKILLMLVRDITTKLEDAKTFRGETEIKLQNYTKIIQSISKTIDQQNNTFPSLLLEVEHFKEMYYELQNKFNEAASKVNNASSEDQRRIRDLEQQLLNEKEQQKAMEEHYKNFIQDKKNNERLMNKQFDSVQKEVLQLSSKNTQLLYEFENFKEKINLQDKDISACKERIIVFENQKKIYEMKFDEHEQAAYTLNDRLMKAQRNLAVIESRMQDKAEVVEDKEAYEYEKAETLDKDSSVAEHSAVIEICGSTDTETHQEDILKNDFAAEERKQADGKNEKKGVGKQLASSSSRTKPMSAKRTQYARRAQASTGPKEVNSSHYTNPHQLQKQDPGPDSPFRSYQN